MRAPHLKLPPPGRFPATPSGVDLAEPLRRAAEEGTLPGAGVVIGKHRELILHGDRIKAALNAHPELSALLFVNPVAVLQDLGFELAPAVRQHILDALSLTGPAAAEMARLDAEIRSGLGEAGARLNLANPADTARILFEVLSVAPLETAGAVVPTRVRPLSPRLARLMAAAAHPARRAPKAPPPSARRRRHGTIVTVPAYKPEVVEIDPEATLPTLPRAGCAPQRVETEELVFYRDAHPLVPSLLRYQLLHHGRLPFRSPAHYREVREGSRTSVWRSWIKAVTYPEREPG
ncbi:hypothetical protein L6R50_13980 [Myxococcota bacterium]|nr:hypothetical protein [Myxococcota bacterium]